MTQELKERIARVCDGPAFDPQVLATITGRPGLEDFAWRRKKAFEKAEAILSLLPPQSVPEWKPTHKHKKRGSTYVVVGQAQVQCEDGLTDYEVVTVYRGRDGQLWVRRKSEFEDGRFEELPASPLLSPDQEKVG